MMSKPAVLINIVLYYPDKKKILDLIDICAQYENTKILLFDNSEDTQPFKFDNNKNIFLFKSPKNVGVGGAHYAACKMAETENFDFVLFLDQDSQLPSGFLTKMIFGFYRLQQLHPRLCAIGPSWSDPRFLGRQQTSKLKNNLRKILKAPNLSHVLISSGMLIGVPTLKNIGYPKREYFIDLVDVEWCLRAKYKNYQVVELADVQMDHMLGEVKLIRNSPLRYRKPMRYYFGIRNSFFLFNDKQISFQFRFFILVSNILEIRKIPFVPNPIASFLAACRGLKDGFLLRNNLEM